MTVPKFPPESTSIDPESTGQSDLAETKQAIRATPKLLSLGVANKNDAIKCGISRFSSHRTI
jgi:hypothetical protein